MELTLILGHLVLDRDILYNTPFGVLFGVTVLREIDVILYPALGKFLTQFGSSRKPVSVEFRFASSENLEFYSEPQTDWSRR